MNGRMLSLDKYPGIRSVRMSETWCLLISKCVLGVIGKEAKSICRIEELTVGVETGITGGYTLCSSYGNRTTKRRTGVFSSLMQGEISMKRKKWPCFGPFGTSGPVLHSLH